MQESHHSAFNYSSAESPDEDAILVMGLQCGDVLLTECVVQRYAPALFRFAFHQLHDTELAEDVVSEVMVRMIGRIEQFQLGQGTFRSWLYKIARNLITDHYRACKRRPEVSLEKWLEASPTCEPGRYDSHLDSLLDRQQIEAGLATLTGEQREVILLHVIEGWELPQIAELLDRSLASVKGLYYRGVESLRRALMRDMDEGCEVVGRGEPILRVDVSGDVIRND